MAEKKEMKAIQEERKIPVFTVLKNGAILKNIFVLNKPPSAPPPPLIPEPKLITTARNAEDQENEEILIVGRHPDCNIMLTHPSISRFHLQIHSKPSSQKLSVMDLSSVHGTWISDKRIEPGIRVELKEGDTLMVGGSSRIYRLHWVPLSCAYDLENQLISALYAPIAEEGKQQNESSLSVDNDEQTEEKNSENPKEVCLDENSLLIENKEIQILGSILEGIESLISEENHEAFVKKEITSTPMMPENMDCTFFYEEEESENSDDGEQRQDLNLWSRPAAEAAKLSPSVEVVMEIENQQVEEGNRSLQHLVLTEVVSERENSESYLRRMEQKSSLISMHSSFSVEEAYPLGEIIEEETENQNPMSTEQDQRDILRLWSKPPAAESVNWFLPVEEIFLERKIQQLDKENQITMPLLASPLLPERGNVESVTTEAKINVLNLNFACSDEEVHPAGDIHEEIENKNISRTGHEQRENSYLLSAPLVAVSVNSTLPVGEVLLDITDKQFNEGNKTPQSRFAASGLSERENLESPAVRSEKKSSLSNIWSRRGKPASALQVRTGRSSRKSIAVSAKNVLQPQKQDIENELVSRALLPSFDEDGDEVFTPNKENITPNTLLLKSMKRKGMLEEIKHSNSKVNLSPIFHSEEDMSASSDKENQTPKFLQKQKSALPSSGKQERLNHEMMEMKRGADRAPFQTLLENSACKSWSEASFSNAATRSNLTVNCTRTMENKVPNPSFNKSIGEEKKSWTIVVDTTTLLNKESMKSLQLLQGLKRTHLIIPRMVIRELDCLKRRGGLFRRTTEASSVLEWIEDCMVKTNRWIHVQSSVEEGGPIAPTPPASPRSPFSSASGGFPSVTTSSVPFSARWSLMDLVSPTAEDHILECALQFKKIKSHEQLVLLSTDVTLKIKSMAEGLICETAEEFRDSLVNPFSERFMWADSSPRGQTWSCMDDVVLREKFYHCSVSKTSKGESAKGLKLILLHNSHYGQITSVS